jgi:hypothetical protein
LRVLSRYGCRIQQREIPQVTVASVHSHALRRIVELSPSRFLVVPYISSERLALSSTTDAPAHTETSPPRSVHINLSSRSSILTLVVRHRRPAHMSLTKETLCSVLLGANLPPAEQSSLASRRASLLRDAPQPVDRSCDGRPLQWASILRPMVIASRNMNAALSLYSGKHPSSDSSTPTLQARSIHISSVARFTSHVVDPARGICRCQPSVTSPFARPSLPCA